MDNHIYPLIRDKAQRDPPQGVFLDSSFNGLKASALHCCLCYHLFSKFVHLCEFHRSLALLLSFILNKHNEPDAFLHSTYLTKTVSNRAKLKAQEKVMF